MKLLPTTILFSLLILSFSGRAEIIPSKDCHIDGLKEAVRTANAGDTVTIPAGSCNWGEGSLSIKAGIQLIGKGMDETEIFRSKPNHKAMISVDCRNRRSISISGITFKGMSDEETSDRGLELFNGCDDFKIFNNRFLGFGNAGIEISDFKSLNRGYLRGIIFHNKFIDNYKFARGYGISIYGPRRSSSPPPFGTDNFVFIEDNYFRGNRHAVASNHDALYVFRHNIIVDNKRQFSAVDAHGKTKPFRNGTKAVEIYNNTISQSEYHPATIGIGLRGGEALIFNNRFTNIGKPILLTMENAKYCKNIERDDSGRPTNVYIWNNEPNDVEVSCKSTILKGLLGDEDKDYFLERKPSYEAFTYPHPLRR